MYISQDIYYENGTVVGNGMEKELTRSENKIMSVLLSDKGNVVSREQLMQALWNTDEFVTDASLTVLISRLRNKLREVSADREIIHTRKGIGYYIV